tara:strand:- start:775 stop:921 length:147 start_codon:yes stop_codon:yes gene_type:complete
MIIMEIANWIINLTLLGMAFVIWMIGLFMLSMLISMSKEYIKRRNQNE